MIYLNRMVYFNESEYLSHEITYMNELHNLRDFFFFAILQTEKVPPILNEESIAIS